MSSSMRATPKLRKIRDPQCARNSVAAISPSKFNFVFSVVPWLSPVDSVMLRFHGRTRHVSHGAFDARPEQMAWCQCRSVQKLSASATSLLFNCDLDSGSCVAVARREQVNHA